VSICVKNVTKRKKRKKRIMCIAPRIEDLDLKDVDTVAIDLETYDPNLKKHGSGAIRGEGFVCGIAIATDKQTLYFPIAHAMTENLDKEETWNELNELIFQNEKITKVFHNAMYDVCWIRSATKQMPKGKLIDTMIAASVLDETRMRYSLDSISKDYLNDSKYKYDLQEKSLSEFGIKDPMSNMHKLPYSLVKDYAEQDVSLTLRLWRIFDKKLDEILYTNSETNENKNCRNIFELETKLFPCLVDMKFKGVRIDAQKARVFGKSLEKRKDNLIKIIKNRTGVDVDLWASASIKKLLDQQKITDYKKTPKSGMPQLPKNYLKTHKNRFLRMIAKARECDKTNGAFVEGLLNFIHNGRIHADINQIRSDDGGTVTGRFSMSNPNLQQIPSKGYIGKKMRELFISEEGCKWGSFDYSQQEPRIVVHYALKLDLPGTDKLQEEFNKDDADFHQIVADMANIPRNTAKTINLGLFYGMGKLKLEKELNLSKQEANNLFNNYHRQVPFVKQLSQDLINFAEEHKLLYTLGDRFCRFNKWETRDRKWNNEIMRFESVPILTEEEAKTAFKAELLEKYNGKVAGDYMKDFIYHYKPAFTYKALNRLIQGSAADMTKKAMVNLYEKGILPQIQIHDELCLSIKDDKEKEIVIETMEKAIPLLIKNKVNCKIGNNWGSIK
jgi:DNA polymerase I-like protein with 3'-5' exonuclease and polymerase domains